MNRLATFGVLARIALRNLVASRWKTIIVGGIIFFGAFLVVIGTSALDSLDRAMSRSITGSVAGHIQVHSKASKEELTVMGGFDMESPDIGSMDDFAKVREVVSAVPNVKAIVPMGINGALVMSGNTIDVELAKLRDIVRKMKETPKEGAASPELLRPYEAQKGHVRRIVEVLKGDIRNIKELQDESALAKEDEEAVEKAASAQFWTDFDKNPYEALEFMENRLALLAADADMLFLRYVGTDPDLFAKSFDRLKIVDGTAIPRGQRGFLFSKYTYEEQVKLKTALRLDKIKLAKQNRGATIAQDPDLQRFVRENSTQVKELLLQLDDIETEAFVKKLQAKLGSNEADLGKLLSAFFKTDDATFADRYDYFYKELAPSLDLYRVRIGDTLTIKAFTKSGYVQSVNLKVYGTFEFTGLEGSPQAGELNIMDMVSFRELYGFLSDDRRAEILALKANAGAKEISRESAEAELFGSAPPAEETGRQVTAQATKDEATAALAGLAGRRTRQDATASAFDPKQLETGIVLNAAVLLHDSSPEKLDETIKAIEAAGEKTGVGLKAISWQQASGIIGQLVVMMRGALYTAVLVIFLVALVIINNAMVMATLERVREIGTLRAVGAQRRFMLGMLVTEGVVVGLLFGAIGAAVGALVVTVVGSYGIPAFSDVATFFFSGPRFHPQLSSTNLVGALAVVFVVSILSSLYPALLAMRVVPRQAMQSEE